MPTTFANSINNNLIYADRAEHDAAGNDIATTYATKGEIPSVPVTDVEVDGVSVVSSGVASITMPTFTQAQANWNESDTSAASYIQNKPSIPSATSDLTNDSGFITLSDVPAQVNADWNSSSGASEILNKPTIPSGAQLVPAATSADADKVLTVNAQGTPAWANAQAPISAGTGIDITNNVVSVDTSVVATQTDLADKEDAFDVGTGLEMDTSGATPTLQVEAPVDIVAGPGIVIDNPDGNTLRVSTDENYETVLFDDTTDIGISKIGEYTLSEAAEHFERIRIYFARGQSFYGDIVLEFNPNSGYYKMASLLCYDTAGTNMYTYFCSFTLSSSKFTELTGKCGYFQVINGTSAGGQVNKTSNWLHPYKIVGIHRIAGGN